MIKLTETNGYAHQRGEICDNAIKALVRDPLFRTRIVRNQKGKGSYRRNVKHRKNDYGRGENPFKNVLTSGFKWVFALLKQFITK